jgi:hypothetical protein
MIVFVQLSKGLTTCDILLGQSTGAPNVLIDLIRDAIYVPHQIRAFWVTMQDNECTGVKQGGAKMQGMSQGTCALRQ